MGSGIGPVGQAIDDVIVRIDALNIRSFSGTGNTINSLIGGDTLNQTSVTLASLGGETAFVFGQAGAFVTTSRNTGVSGATSRTMAAWVKFGKKANQGVMSTGANGSGTGMALETSSTVWTLGRGNVGTATTVTYNTHQWYYAVYVSQQTSGTTHNVKLYINGGLAHTAIVTGINLTNSTLKIGFNNSAIGISGQISRANFYKKALTDREIQKSYWNYKSRYGL
jgi:hypothetical protein